MVSNDNDLLKNLGKNTTGILRYSPTAPLHQYNLYMLIFELFKSDYGGI